MTASDPRGEISQEIGAALLLAGQMSRPLSERIHGIRVACRRARALARVVSPASPEAAAALRTSLKKASDELSELREGDALVEAAQFLSLPVHSPTRLLPASDATAALAAAHAHLMAARDAIGMIEVAPTAAATEESLRRAFGRLHHARIEARRRQGARLRHEFRKRLKDFEHLYALATGTDDDDVLTAARKASRLLGLERDLGALVKRLSVSDGSERSDRVLIRRRRRVLRRKAFAAGKRLERAVKRDMPVLHWRDE